MTLESQEDRPHDERASGGKGSAYEQSRSDRFDASERPVVLSAEGLVKRYPGVVALDQVDFEIREGEVHGLIGENGAGKSTLMHILAGASQPTDGKIRLARATVDFANPRQAMDSGIALVHQELNLVPYLSVAENIFLGCEETRWGWIDSAKQVRRCYELLADLDATIDPREPVHRLRVGQQQVVEIAKALNSNARVIFMDEPTSAISDQEVASLFALIDSLRADGVAIVYVSHKLDELFQICDRITVLRDGKLVDTVQVADTDHDTIVRLMVGRKLDELYIHSEVPRGRERLRLKDWTYHAKQMVRPAVDQVSLSAYEGEVLGVFGLMGAGRTELLESVFGLHIESVSGTLTVDGEVVQASSPAVALDKGIGLVPEDRKQQGLVLSLSVAQNMSLSNLKEVEENGLLSGRREREHAQAFVEQFAIRTPSVQQAVRSLSGGNQQKVVLSKVLSRNPRVLLLDEPTRGIDVNAKREIYGLIDRLKQQGMAILVVSSELPELLGIADRVMVMCEGRVSAEFSRAEANEEVIMHAAVPRAEGSSADPVMGAGSVTSE